MNLEEYTASILLLLAFAGSVSTLYLAFRGRNSSAGIVAAFSVTSIVLTALPSIELIKAWGMEARLRGQVFEAKSLLAELKSANSVFIAQGYNSLSTEAMLGTTRLSELLDTAADLNIAAKRVGLSADKVSKARDRFFDQITYRSARQYLSDRDSKVAPSESSARARAKETANQEKEAREFKIDNFSSRVIGDGIVNFIPEPERSKFLKVWEQVSRDLLAAPQGKQISPLLDSIIGQDMDAFEKASDEWLKSHP
jgi:hypothetical protein